MSDNLFDQINPIFLFLMLEVEIEENGKPRWLNGLPDRSHLVQP